MNSLMSIPVGFRFNPTDEELLGFYLYNRIFNSENFKNSYIKDIDLYGDVEPWEVWEKHRGDNDAALYCFTALKKKVAKVSTSRISRTVASGTWAGENSGGRIEIPNSGVFGLKKRFRYEKEGSRYNGGWFMFEYSISGCNDIVLCCLKPNPRKSKKRTGGYCDEGDEDLSKRRKTELIVDNCPNQRNNSEALSSSTSCSRLEFLASQGSSLRQLDSGVNCSEASCSETEFLAHQESASQQLDSRMDWSEAKPFSDLETELLPHQESTSQQPDSSRIQQRTEDGTNQTTIQSQNPESVTEENCFQDSNNYRNLQSQNPESVAEKNCFQDSNNYPSQAIGQSQNPESVAEDNWFQDSDDFFDVSMIFDSIPEVSDDFEHPFDNEAEFSNWIDDMLTSQSAQT